MMGTLLVTHWAKTSSHIIYQLNIKNLWNTRQSKPNQNIFLVEILVCRCFTYLLMILFSCKKLLVSSSYNFTCVRCALVFFVIPRSAMNGLLLNQCDMALTSSALFIRWSVTRWTYENTNRGYESHFIFGICQLM